MSKKHVEIIYGYCLDNLSINKINDLNNHVNQKAKPKDFDKYHLFKENCNLPLDSSVDWQEIFSPFIYNNGFSDFIAVHLDSWYCDETRKLSDVKLTPGDKNKKELEELMNKIFEEFPELSDYFSNPEVWFYGE